MSERIEEDLLVAAVFNDLEQRNSDGDVMRDAVKELTRLRQIERAARAVMKVLDQHGQLAIFINGNPVEDLRTALGNGEKVDG